MGYLVLLLAAIYPISKLLTLVVSQRTPFVRRGRSRSAPARVIEEETTIQDFDVDSFEATSTPRKVEKAKSVKNNEENDGFYDLESVMREE